MRVAIVDTVGSPYDGSTPSKRGLGGSESAVVFIARELAKIGFTVHVYNDCEGLDAQPGRYDGVEYRPVSHLTAQSLRYDVAIVSRSTHPFNGYGTVRDAKHRVLWMHDTFCDGDSELEKLAVEGVIDEIWTLSDWHTTYISQCTHGHRRMMEVLKRKIWVTRNGVNLYREPDFKNKNRNSFVFNAAVSKGMETLLNDVWPKVKERIPDALLTVIGGAYPLRQEDVQHDLLYQLIKKYDNQNGVQFTGLIKQEDVSKFLSRASFMIYPQSFPETFGISTVEALAYGTPVISGRFGAMEETALNEACYLMDYPVDSNVLYTFNRDFHIEKFVDMVVEAYNNDYLWQQKSQKAVVVREVCGWDKVALQWKQHIYKSLWEYLPKEDYIAAQRINHRTHELFNKRWSNPEEWGFYPEIEKSIQVIVPFYNNVQLLKRCIESIKSQNYENYRVLLVDDSSEESIEYNELPDKFEMWSSDKNQGALANQIWALDELDLGEEDIIVLIDGDDALGADNNIFKKINQLHCDYDFTYGSCWSAADQIPLIAQEYPDAVKRAGNFKGHHFPWFIPYTHLRTFKFGLYCGIDHSNLRDDNGVYFRASGDTALFYELIQRCDPVKIKAVKDVMYIYNDNLSTNDFRIRNDEQIKTVNKIMSGVKDTESFRASRFVQTSTEGVTIDNTNKTKEIEELVEDLKNVDMSHLKKQILIAIPTALNIHPETFKSIYDLKVPDGYEVDFQFFYGYCIDQVRNLIANYAVENYYDYLFCVDYDIEFAPDTLEKLLRDNVDIVTGLYIQRKPGQHILEIYRRNKHGAHYNVSLGELSPTMELEAINGCGLGCCLIKTEVLKEVGYPQFTYHHAIRMEDTVSEDVDFCTKAESKGFNIFVNTSVRCRHYGKTAFEV